MGKRLRLLLTLALFAGPYLAAEGAGGVFVGLSQPDLRPDFMPENPPGLPELEYFGSYGYGVARNGYIMGGYGLALAAADFTLPEYQDPAGRSVVQVYGGLAGMLVGGRAIGIWPLHFDVGIRLGLGLLDVTYDEQAGQYRTGQMYFLYQAEPYAELGLALLPWMSLSATASYPCLGRLDGSSGLLRPQLLHLLPALGLSLSFGSF